MGQDVRLSSVQRNGLPLARTPHSNTHSPHGAPINRQFCAGSGLIWVTTGLIFHRAAGFSGHSSAWNTSHLFTIRCQHSSSMLATTAVVVLWCAPPVSPFTTVPHVSRTSNRAPPPFAPVAVGGHRRWASSMARTRRRQRTSTYMSNAREDANSDFDPLGLFRSDSSSRSSSSASHRNGLQPTTSVRSRRVAARSSLHALKSGINDRDGPSREREGGVKSSLRAIKIGMDEAVEAHTTRETAKEVQLDPSKSVAVAKGWDYWKYRVLLLGVALLWGTNFPAVCGDGLFLTRGSWLASVLCCRPFVACRNV